MYRHQFLTSIALCGSLAAALASGACGRAEQDMPAAEVQSQATQLTHRPMTVAGCLLAGEAANTYVLTAARADGSAESATYQLVSEPDADLQAHVGQRVQIEGTLELRDSTTAQTLATPAETDAPAGTSGAADVPMVQTRTDVAINRLSVDSVRPLGEECGM